MSHSGRENGYQLEKDWVRFTLFPLTSGSHPKIKHKMGEQNKVADDLGQSASLLLMQKNEIVELD